MGAPAGVAGLLQACRSKPEVSGNPPEPLFCESSARWSFQEGLEVEGLLAVKARNACLQRRGRSRIWGSVQNVEPAL